MNEPTFSVSQMQPFSDREVQYLREAMVSTRAAVRGRPVIIGAVAAAFSPMVGWRVALAWFAVSLVLNHFLAPWVEASVNSRARPQAWTWRMIAYMVAAQAVTGSIGVIAAYDNGVWGLCVAYFGLTSMTMLAATVSGRSAIYFYACAAPIAVFLAILDWYSFGLSAPMAGPFNIVVGSVLVAVIANRTAKLNRDNCIALGEARSQAEAASAAKSAFVAMVSHDLRTPISGILAGAAELEAAGLAASQRANAGLIAQSARMMGALLNDLLDLSKIEAGKMSVDNRPFDLRETLLDCVSFWRPDLRRRGLRLRIVGAHAAPRWVAGDPTRLRQVLNNLFSNAAKFTDEGGVTLAVAVEMRCGRAYIAIDLIDTGQGMGPDQLDRLFGAFEQGLATGPGDVGTGLGLHISREFAQLMGGDLTARSTLGQGSCFTLTLAMDLAEAPAQEAPAADRQAQPTLRVLLADDHEVNRRAFSLMLAPVCASLVCVESGEAALAALGASVFDVVLMDINMPRLGGVATTQRLRAEPGPNQTCPVIALTGSASAAETASYLAAGMQGVVAKPVEARALFAAIDEVLDAAAEIEVCPEDRRANG